MNDGTETETDFLGHNEPSDENHVSHLVDSMSENNSDNQCNSYEYSPPPPGRKVDNLDSFIFFQQQQVKCVLLARLHLQPGPRAMWRVPWHRVEVVGQAESV